uniref:Uncharacterized protein n=1 Tax=Avena sativa TaxID=4498 RepID=A0ACD5ZKH1_AVESA
MGRAPCCEKVGLKRGRWTREEDGILARYIKEHGEGAWRSLPKNAGLLRCGKSCRLRWINYLRADLKRGNISEEEEGMIIKLHATLGNRWSLIAGHLPGRTDNEIKNHWNSHLSKRPREGGDGVVVDVDFSKLPGGGKRKGGRRPSSTKPKGKPKKRAGRTKTRKAAENHDRETSERNISASPPFLQGEEQASHACASGVTSDGLEECEEMVSGLKGHPSPNLDATTDCAVNMGDSEPPKAADQDEMELDHDVSCNHSEKSARSGPAESAGQEELGDKAVMDLGQPECCNEDDSWPSEPTGQLVLDGKDIEWDLVELDHNLANDDLWSSLVWDFDDMVVPKEEESVLSGPLFFDSI